MKKFILFLMLILLCFNCLLAAPEIYFYGVDKTPLTAFSPAKKYPLEIESTDITFRNPHKAYSMIKKTILSPMAKRKILFLADSNNSAPWTALAPEVAVHLNEIEDLVVFQSDIEIPLSASLPKIHIDNNSDSDFENLITKGIAPFDVIIMQRGLCLCQWVLSEDEIYQKNFKTCCGISTFSTLNAQNFLKRAVSVLNIENNNSFILMLNRSNIVSEGKRIAETFFWHKVVDDLVSSKDWNNKVEISVIVSDEKSRIFMGIYIIPQR